VHAPFLWVDERLGPLGQGVGDGLGCLAEVVGQPRSGAAFFICGLGHLVLVLVADGGVVSSIPAGPGLQTGPLDLGVVL